MRRPRLTTAYRNITVSVSVSNDELNQPTHSIPIRKRKPTTEAAASNTAFMKLTVSVGLSNDELNQPHQLNGGGGGAVTVRVIDVLELVAEPGLVASNFTE